MYASLDKASNSKNFRIKESKPKTHEPKTLNLNNSLYPNPKKMLKPPKKLKKRRKSIGGKKNMKKGLKL